MRVLSKPVLVAFWSEHPHAKQPLSDWHSRMRKGSWSNFVELKTAFPRVDQVGEFTVFNVGGNKYRLIAAIHYNVQKVFIRCVLTHDEYDLGKWKHS